MTEAITRHRLEGMEPDNLLAFLALLGLLRSLDMVHPDWGSRAYWGLDVAPLRPYLTTSQSITRDELSTAVCEGLRIFREALHPFSWPRSKKGDARKTSLASSRSRLLSLSSRCLSAAHRCQFASRERQIWQLRCDLIASSAATHPYKPEEIEQTPLKLPSGQMSFLGAQYDLVNICKSEDISKCFFQRWTYDHEGNSLRFSPEEAQRYAYRASDPSPEGSRTELGASALSSLGLLSFPMSESHRHWKMPGYSGRRNEGRISWPIWTDEFGRGSSLCAIEAMLRLLPFERGTSMKVFGPKAMIATARRYVLDPNQGDYGNISRAKIEPISE